MLVTMTFLSPTGATPRGSLWSKYRVAFRHWVEASSRLRAMEPAAGQRTSEEPQRQAAQERADAAEQAYGDARDDLTAAMLNDRP